MSLNVEEVHHYRFLLEDCPASAIEAHNWRGTTELPTNMIRGASGSLPPGSDSADKQRVKLLPSEKGLDLPEQVQTHLIKAAVRPRRR